MLSPLVCIAESMNRVHMQILCSSFLIIMEEDIALRLTAEDALEWYYRGEGAGNIVLYHLNSNPLLVSFFSHGY